MGISLAKRAESAGTVMGALLEKVSLEKKTDFGAVSAEVIVALDYSGSMEDRYRSGEVQEITERCLGVSLGGLDDDGKIQLFPFHDGVLKMQTIDQKNADGFINKWMKGKDMGGTNYSPVINAIVKFCKTEGYLNPGKPPVFVIFVTDGEPGDKENTTRLLIEHAKLPIFWQFVGLGYHPEFLEKLDKMGGRVIDNVGLFSNIKDTKKITDDEFYQELLKEFFSSWLPEAQKLKIVSKIPG